tara:strand:+ start:17928 stop:18074 length:147 start_codon:yes stop_codon:yes gene_type:complete
MSIKKFKKVDTKGREEIWQWDETPELSQAIKNLHNSGLKSPPPRPVDS